MDRYNPCDTCARGKYIECRGCVLAEHNGTGLEADEIRKKKSGPFSAFTIVRSWCEHCRKWHKQIKKIRVYPTREAAEKEMKK